MDYKDLFVKYLYASSCVPDSSPSDCKKAKKDLISIFKKLIKGGFRK